MVRHRRFGVALIGLALLFALAIKIAFAAATPISTTPHNFAFGGTSTIKAASGGGSDTQQICVFCHTPHSANTSMAAPIWNKQLSVATYSLYASDYLTGLGYPTPVLGTGQSSRLCLSCHDGTVALGSVYNLSGTGNSGTIPMAKSGSPITTLPAGASNLGINLADDHPVGFLYQPGAAAGQDPELVSGRTFPWPKGVQLEPNTAAGRVECKSCHDPHNNQYTKFLRVSNTNAGLCTYCHNKTNYALSVHATSTQAYTPTVGGTATTVGENSCRNCHKAHTASGTPLLRGAEENTCYDAGCHGGNNPITGNTTQATNNIQPEMSKTHTHPTNTISGKHKDMFGGETAIQLGDTGAVNRHAECNDCHNPHQPQVAVAKNTRGTLRISAALNGTWGVEPSWTSPLPLTTMTTNAVTFATPASFTKVSGSLGTLTDEYQVCMKCHSNYVTLPAGARNIAAEINPNNSSYHGIVPLQGPITTTNTTNFYVNQNTMAQPWAGPNAYTAAQAEALRLAPVAYARGRVWCSDCHNSELTPAYPSAKSTTVPSGPHGSTLNGTAVGTSNGDKMLIGTITSTSAGTPLCLKCHGKGLTATVYASTATNSRFSRHGGASMTVEGCFACHMWDNANAAIGGNGKIYPHGMNKKWAKIGSSAVAGSGQMDQTFVGGWYTNIDYTLKKCYAETGAGAAVTGSPCGTHTGVGGNY